MIYGNSHWNMIPYIPDTKPIESNLKFTVVYMVNLIIIFFTEK